MGLTSAGRASVRLGATAVLASLLVSSCASTDDVDAARRTADDFASAVRSDDGAAACALLMSSTRSTVEESAGQPCEEAVVDEVGADPGTARDAEVFGTAAQVRMEDDTLFLARYDGRWLVLAAGCRPRGELPYDCQVEGG
jgi:hypothetical protein